MGRSQHNYILPSSNPMYRIGLSLPVGSSGNSNATSDPAKDTNWYIPQTQYLNDYTNISPIRISNEYELRVYLYPTKLSVFDKNPEVWLFRQINRMNTGSNKNKFRADGKHWVHPSHYPVVGNPSLFNGKFYGGTQNCLMPRITEVIFPNTGDFYGGASSAPNGLNFPFKPLTWFNTDPVTIENAGITFPQVMFNDTGSGFGKGGGIQAGSVFDTANQSYVFKYSGYKGRYGKQRTHFHFAVALMIDNPDYDGGTQIARKILASNFADFTLSFKTQNLNDPSDGILRKYALNWRFSLGTPHNQ